MNRRGFLRSLGAGLATVALSTKLGTARLELAPVEGDFATSDLRYKAYERYSQAWTSRLAASMLETREQHMANVLNRSFGSSVTQQPRYRDAQVQFDRAMRALIDSAKLASRPGGFRA